jgi:thiamine-phosphate pyrophosphorylase
VDVAVAADADGAHVGQEDLPAGAARRVLGPDRLLGVSASVIEEAVTVERDGADYLGFGAMYATPTKQDAEYAGPAMLAEVRRRVRLPIVAIGGITEANLSPVRDSGADLIAVVSAIAGAPDPAAAARRLLAGLGAGCPPGFGGGRE